MLLAALLLLGACNSRQDESAATNASAAAESGAPPTASSGQVAATPAAPQATFYAASRLAEQASFGPTPALVADIQARGIAGWIDRQLGLPASQIDLAPFLVDPVPGTDWNDGNAAFASLAIAAPDQLRLRVAWVLGRFIATGASGDLLGYLVFQNLLINRSFSRYETLLYDVTVNPRVGAQFGLRQNRPRSAGCAHCSPNTDYPRLLLEGHTLGSVLLDAAGEPARDARGRQSPAYTSADVQELTRALTGWNFKPYPPGATWLPRDWANWRQPMVASVFPGERDFGSKRFLGSTLPEYQEAGPELQQVLSLLAAHPNTPVLLARRLIQGLVKSQPSAAYVQRVAAVFRDNGRGVRGDLAALVKAVLLDVEARAADNPLSATADDGRLREPFLATSAVFRAFGCQRMPRWDWGGIRTSQTPFFSPVSPYDTHDRAPVSQLLSPGQRLLTSDEFISRSHISSWLYDYDNTGRPDTTRSVAAGCSPQDMSTRYDRSTAEFMAWMGERFFRGALPPALRQNLELTMRQRPWNQNYPSEAPTRLLGFALASPYWGVIE